MTTSVLNDLTSTQFISVEWLKELNHHDNVRDLNALPFFENGQPNENSLWWTKNELGELIPNSNLYYLFTYNKEETDIYIYKTEDTYRVFYLDICGLDKNRCPQKLQSFEIKQRNKIEIKRQVIENRQKSIDSLLSEAVCNPPIRANAHVWGCSLPSHDKQIFPRLIQLLNAMRCHTFQPELVLTDPNTQDEKEELLESQSIHSEFSFYVSDSDTENETVSGKIIETCDRQAFDTAIARKACNDYLSHLNAYSIKDTLTTTKINIINQAICDLENNDIKQFKKTLHTPYSSTDSRPALIIRRDPWLLVFLKALGCILTFTLAYPRLFKQVEGEKLLHTVEKLTNDSSMNSA